MFRIARSPAMAAFATSLMVTVCSGGDWLQFRGNLGTGVAPEADPPLSWKVDGEGDENIAWKAELPGRGVSGPIVAAGRVIVTSATGFVQSGMANEGRLRVSCYSAETGERLWERQFWATGRTFCHPTSSVAAPTPASDGERIFAFFSSNDLICLDLDGNLKWYRGLAAEEPAAGNDVGMASSPVVSGTTCVVQVENLGASFAAGIDTRTGATKWKVERARTMNWASPSVARGKTSEEDLVLLQSPTHVSAHRADDGQEVWSFKADCQPIPSAVADAERVLIPANGLTAVRTANDTSTPPSLWKEGRLNPGNSSPVLLAGRVFTLSGTVLTCGDAATGDELWKLRLKGNNFWATPVIAGNRMYVVNDEGGAQVVHLGDKEGKVVGAGSVGEQVLATPAIAGDALFIRGEKHVFKVAAG